MTKKDFKVFIKRNPKLKKYYSMTRFDGGYGKYTVIKRSGKFEVIYHNEDRGLEKVFQCQLETEAYNYLYFKFTKYHLKNKMIEELYDFLIEAKKQTYANLNIKKVEPSRPGSQDYHYENDEMIYHDTYFGSSNFMGEEVVMIK